MNKELSHPMCLCGRERDHCGIVPGLVAKVEVCASPDARGNEEPRGVQAHPGRGNPCAGKVDLVAQPIRRDEGAHTCV